jgi:hypothetical protein
VYQAILDCDPAGIGLIFGWISIDTVLVVNSTVMGRTSARCRPRKCTEAAIKIGTIHNCGGFVPFWYSEKYAVWPYFPIWDSASRTRFCYGFSGPLPGQMK